MSFTAACLLFSQGRKAAFIFGNRCQELALRVGPKAWHLARLIQQNHPVPRGFVVISDALEQFLIYHDLKDRIREPNFPQLIQKAAIPGEIQQEINQSYAQLKRHAYPLSLSVAVRSSSSAEDLKEASFAGQYETFLNINHFPSLLESIKSCWASLFSNRIKQYAQNKNMNADSFLMGVLVQQMVAADVSGVIFSMNPVTQNRNEIVMNVSYGLGEAIVSGLVTPDTYFIDKQNGTLHKDLGFKEVKIIAELSGTSTIETTIEEQNRFCLPDEQIHTLAEETKRIEALHQQHVDIEFALSGGIIYILQVRPIT